MITICKILPLLDKETFLNNINTIFHICLITVHADMMKKLDKNTYIAENFNPTSQSMSKNLNIRQSERKRCLSLNDYLSKIDVHLFFIENINVK